MLFRTKDGTKFTIKVEPIAKDHIEPYTPSPINMNCTLHNDKTIVSVREITTQLEQFLDCLLDEWANAFQFDPIDEVNGTGLGINCIHEEHTPIPNLSNENSDMHGLWVIFFNGSRTKYGAGAVYY